RPDRGLAVGVRDGHVARPRRGRRRDRESDRDLRGRDHRRRRHRDVRARVWGGPPPWPPLRGGRREIVGTGGRVTVAVADVPSAKLAVTVKPEPLVNAGGFGSPAKPKTATPSGMRAA